METRSSSSLSRSRCFGSFAAIGLISLVALTGCDSIPGFKSKAKSANDYAPHGIASETMTTSAVAPASGSAAPPAASASAQTPAIYTPGLSVSDLIALACGITATAGRSVTPSFEFDSAALGEADRQMLAEVAKCLTEGTLKGKALSLVGRADPRGEAEYNMTLGESRANAVQRYLIDLGVGKGRSHVTSRGEMDAVGKNEEGWAQDRRVDIELAL